MHTVSLDKYADVRNVVVSYLQAKRVWLPQATYAGSSAKRDPNATDIGKVDDKKGHKGKDKGKADGKGKPKGGDKGKGGKDGKGKNNKDQDKPKCATCWSNTHTTDKCWYNTKGKSKGGDQGKHQQQRNVNSVNDDANSTLSAGPSASQVGSQASTMPTKSAMPKQPSGVRTVTDQPRVLVVRQDAQVKSGNDHADALTFWDQPGWHELPEAKVFVVHGKLNQVRNHATPGRESDLFSLRTTWVWKKGEWKRTEHRKRWKLFHNPHAPLEGNPVWAVMKFEPARDWQIARLQSRGDLLVDTGACVSVCKPDAFGAKVDRSAKQDLYSVDDTLLKSRGECRPVLKS